MATEPKHHDRVLTRLHAAIDALEAHRLQTEQLVKDHLVTPTDTTPAPTTDTET